MPTSPRISVLIQSDILLSLKGHQTTLPCDGCSLAHMMFGVSVEIPKDEIFKSLSTPERFCAGLCTVRAILYFLAGEGEDPFVKRRLSGGQCLGMARGMHEA